MIPFLCLILCSIVPTIPAPVPILTSLRTSPGAVPAGNQPKLKKPKLPEIRIESEDARCSAATHLHPYREETSTTSIRSDLHKCHLFKNETISYIDAFYDLVCQYCPYKKFSQRNIEMAEEESIRCEYDERMLTLATYVSTLGTSVVFRP